MTKEEKFEKALELACADTADEQCPHEFDFCNWNECKDCDRNEFHYNSERDMKCWKKYYLEKALESDTE